MINKKRSLLWLTILVVIYFSGCMRMSKEIRDDSAGFNGGFEVVKSDLPVNWLIYSPETIPYGDYNLVIDKTIFKEGRQSLKFVVRECSGNGGWHSPGFCNEFEAIPGKTYSVGFWIQNDGCEFVAKIGGVSAKAGKYETIIKSAENFSDWTYFEYDYKMPSGDKFNRIRFEMNILKPGTFLIDDLKIVDLNGTAVKPAF